MKKLLLTSGTVLLALGLMLTAAIAWLSQDFHAALMQQIAASGLAVEQDAQFRTGLLRARNSGRLKLAQGYCPGCDVLQYSGTIYHGLGTLLNGQLDVASVDYALQWPELPIQPALPALQLQAAQALTDGWTPALKAHIQLPPSQHTLATPGHRYQLQNGGLQGQLEPAQLQLRNPHFTLERDGETWLKLQQTQLQAAAGEALTLQANSNQLAVPAWDWQGQGLDLDYQQQGASTQLDVQLKGSVQAGTLAGKDHAKAQAQLLLQRLNLDATLAFARELPQLLSPQTTGAARMLGLFSLYSVHGPGFFAPHPTFALDAVAVPLAHGQLDMHIELAVTEQTRRPPMHPLEWQRALRGQIDITAPPQHLAAGWHWAAPFVNYVTGLPQRYSQMQQQGWVESLPDGRERLRIVLDPITGPRKP